LRSLRVMADTLGIAVRHTRARPLLQSLHDWFVNPNNANFRSETAVLTERNVIQKGFRRPLIWVRRCIQTVRLGGCADKTEMLLEGQT
jgi:hypothetical protein